MNRQCTCKPTALKVVARDGLLLRFLAHDLRKDAEVVTAAVTQNGLALEFACPIMRDNWDVIGVAMTQNPTAFQFASEHYQWRKVMMTLARGQSAEELCRHLPDKLLDNRNFMTAVISMSARRNEYSTVCIVKMASTRLHDDKAFMLAAVAWHGDNLEHASDRLKDNLDFILKVQIE